jgi:hypothetical protein
MCARGAVWPDTKFLLNDFPSQHLNACCVSAPGAWQTDICGVDSESVHQVQQLNLLFDGRLRNRRRLQSIAQGFIIKPNMPVWRHQGLVDGVPVVD